jgi:hypothetical protein
VYEHPIVTPLDPLAHALFQCDQEIDRLHHVVDDQAERLAKQQMSISLLLVVLTRPN